MNTKPIAPPKGRLDSLSTATTPRPGAAAAPGSSGAGSAGASKLLKFKPKAVQRRAKEERESLDAKYEQQQKEQAEQKAAAAAAAAAATAGGGPGGRDGPHRGRDGAGRKPRGGRGRGRGRGGFGSIGPTTASGPFALGSVFSGRQKVMAERGVVSGGSSGVKRSLSYKARKKSEEVMVGGKADYSSSDESDGQRMDVEYISLLDEEDDDDEGKAMETDWGAGAPIRIPRREHVDRQAMVNTDASSKKGKAELKAMKEKEMTFETEIKVKDEPVDDNGVMPLPSSLEVPKRKVKVSESPEMRRKDANRSPTSRRRRRSSSSRRKPVVTTTEEKEELEREEADRVFALNELGGELPDVKVKAVDTDGDVNMANGPTRNAETENQIFFFQFPNILPHLVPAVKSEPKPEPADSSVGSSEQKSPSTAIDTKPELSKKKNPKASLKAQLTLLTAPPSPGLVGKLRVHKSGRVSMLWGTPVPEDAADGEDEAGPLSMDVARGASCEFLQEVVVMKEGSPYGDEDLDEKGGQKGVAYSLGQVKGKYVVAPDFGKLIEASNGKKGKKKAKEGKGKEKVEV